MSELTAVLAARRARYQALLDRTGGSAALLASGPGVQHATGVRIYSQAIIPERPVVAVVGRDRTALAIWEWDAPQVGMEQPDLELATFPEFGRDPWSTVAALVTSIAGPSGRVIVEETCPAPAIGALEAVGLEVVIDIGFEGFLAARSVKDAGEIALATNAAQAADRAIASVASRQLGGLSERAVANAIASAFRERMDGEVEAAGIVVGPAHLRATHHLASDEPLTPGAIRLGLMARIDGMWSLLTRMAWGSDAAGPGGDSGGEPSGAAFAADYAAYIDAHTAGWQAMRPGVAAGDIYALVRERLTANGLRLRSPKVGHGTGLSFREAPVLRADDPTPLPAESVYAFDYAVYQDSTRSGAFVHVEDRILVTATGSVRISDVTDTSAPYTLDLSPAR
ncbi:MAG TPA: M24 family metallopeptidase [Candidatus Limnocylindrales bacterium]|nr:M24 family metallopeptidase [Candidatus Limnocylindrales bacterium]